MRKIILSLVMAFMASSAFAEDAESLMSQYKSMKGANYGDITDSMKVQAERVKDKLPQNYDLAKRIKKIHFVIVELNADDMIALAKRIENIDNYKCIYQIKENVVNAENETSTDYPNRQYYGIEDKGVIKEAIARVDFRVSNRTFTSILHVVGDLKIDDMLNMMGFEEINKLQNL